MVEPTTRNIMNHDDPIRGPLYRFSPEALREYRREHRRQWHGRPRLYRRIPIRCYEPLDMLKLMVGAIGTIGTIAAFAGLLLDWVS
jgi:hypothetical protein